MWVPEAFEYFVIIKLWQLYLNIVMSSVHAAACVSLTVLNTSNLLVHLQTAELVGTLTGHTGNINCIKWIPRAGAHLMDGYVS